MSVLALSECAAIALVTGSLVEVEAGALALAGARLGFAFLVRPECLIVAAALALGGLVRVRRGTLAARAWGSAVLVCLAFVLAGVAYTRAANGVWTLSPKLGALHVPAADWRSVEDPDATPATTAPALGGVPAAFARHGAALLWVWPWPLLLLSTWAIARRRTLEAFTLVPWFALAWTGLTQQGRFALPAVPALALLASRAVATPGRRFARAAALAALALGVVFAVASMADAFRTPFDGDFAMDRRAGEWLAHVASPGDVVEDRKPFVAFYAGCPHRALATGGYEAVVSGAVHDRVRWLVLQEFVVRQLRPDLAPLLDGADVRAHEPRLSLRYAGADPVHGSLAIFRVRQPDEPPDSTPPFVDTRGFARARD